MPHRNSFIRAETNNGVELVEFVLAVMRDPTWDPRARLFAATWLADRGFGKPPQAEAPKPGEESAKRLALPPEIAVLVYKAYLRGEMTLVQDDQP